jgi:hypothetical protein
MAGEQPRTIRHTLVTISAKWAESDLTLSELGLLYYIGATGATREKIIEVWGEDAPIERLASLSPIDLLNPSAPKKKVAGERKKSQHQINLKALEDTFVEATGIAAPRPTTDRARKEAAFSWWSPLREMMELCEGDVERTVSLIRDSVSHLVDAELTISSPQSIKKTAVYLNAKSSSYTF